MIIFPAIYLTAPLAGVSLGNPRLCYQTYLRDLDPSAIVASSSAAGAPADAPLHFDTAEYWQPGALPATWIATLPSAYLIDYVGLAGHTLGSCHASAKIELSTDGITWTAFGSEILPADDAPLLFLNDSTLGSRIRLTVQGSGDVPKIASIYAGQALAMERPLQGGFSPLGLSRETELYQALSRGGQILGQDFRRMGVVGQVQFKNLSDAWYRTYFDPFVRAARKAPFFFAWDPAGHPLDVAYVWSEQDIRPQYMQGLPLFQVGFSMRGIGNA